MNAHGVEFRVGEFRLGPLDLQGPTNRPWLFLGPSGAGKSLLLQLVSGRLRPSAGRLVGPRCLYLPQRPESVLVGRNLAEDLSGSVRPAAVERSRLRDALARTGVPGVPLSARSRGLSAGRRRLLALTLISLAPAEAWALDEPDAGLDRAACRKVQEVLRSVIDDGKMIYLASHRPAIYAALDPWVIVLDRGRLVATGSWCDIVSNANCCRLLGLNQAPALRTWQLLGHPLGELLPGSSTPEFGPNARLKRAIARKIGVS